MANCPDWFRKDIRAEECYRMTREETELSRKKSRRNSGRTADFIYYILWHTCIQTDKKGKKGIRKG